MPHHCHRGLVDENLRKKWMDVEIVHLRVGRVGAARCACYLLLEPRRPPLNEIVFVVAFVGIGILADLAR